MSAGQNALIVLTFTDHRAAVQAWLDRLDKPSLDMLTSYLSHALKHRQAIPAFNDWCVKALGYPTPYGAADAPYASLFFRAPAEARW